MNIVLNMYL